MPICQLCCIFPVCKLSPHLQVVLTSMRQPCVSCNVGIIEPSVDTISIACSNKRAGREASVRTCLRLVSIIYDAEEKLSCTCGVERQAASGKQSILWHLTRRQPCLVALSFSVLCNCAIPARFLVHTVKARKLPILQSGPSSHWCMVYGIGVDFLSFRQGIRSQMSRYAIR